MIKPKWGSEHKSPIVIEYHNFVRTLVEERTNALGGSWAELSSTLTLELLCAADLEKLERIKLESGYRFDPGATISAKESPEKYKPLPSVTEATGPRPNRPRGADDPIASGDNVRTFAELEGVILRVRSIEHVFELLSNGVPDRSIALIDDSGGTLTAPILNKFVAILCLGGTVRSHLAILSREYGIPCLMNVELVDDLETGDIVRVEYSAPARTAASYDAGGGDRARVWQLSVSQNDSE